MAMNFRIREQIRGGGVGAYIKETVKQKRRKDIESKYPDLEYLWLEIQGWNKHSNLLLGTIYRSTRMLGTQQWLEQMENMLREITTSGDGLLILTGDTNINLLNSDAPLTKQHLDILLFLFLITTGFSGSFVRIRPRRGEVAFWGIS